MIDTEQYPTLLIDGQHYPLRLTLGALAKIEEALGGGSFEELRARLEKPNANDILTLVQALIGGGGAELSLEALRASDLDLAATMQAITAVFAPLKDGQQGKP